MSCPELYNGFRKDCGPTLYASNKTPQTVDVLEAGLLFAAAILAFSFFVILPGYKGQKLLFTSIHVFFCLFVVTSIMICNFGQEWEVAHLNTATPYRAGINEEIHADIGVLIGLRSINITLRATPDLVVEFKNGTHMERIDYNERYHWNDLGFTQGRAGFGPQAGLFNREFRESQFKGTPLPILWIAEYFTFDGEGIRWGRHYRQAGWYTHIMVWTAFPCWILAMMLPYIVIRYSGYFSLLTGACLLTGNILYLNIRNLNDLSGAIAFEDGHLEFSWGWCFWLNLVNGIICLIIGLLILIGDLRFSEKITLFFGVDILQEFEEYYESADKVLEIIENTKKRREKRGFSIIYPNSSDNGHANMAMEAEEGMGMQSVYEDVEGSKSPVTPERHFRRRGETNAITVRKLVAKNKKTMPRPKPKALPPEPQAETSMAGSNGQQRKKKPKTVPVPDAPQRDYSGRSETANEAMFSGSYDNYENEDEINEIAKAKGGGRL